MMGSNNDRSIRLRLAAMLAMLCGIVAALGSRANADPPADFARDLQPIFRSNCASCHRATPGDPRAILARVRGDGGKPRMPLGRAPLSARQIEQIRVWSEKSVTKTALPWAYRPLTRPLEPPLSVGGIDAFVQARLLKAGLKPSPRADKVTLIRRVTLDLTGLPPSPAEVDAFVADRAPDAYEKVVDRLLENRHFGERMALPWLDAARYADSNGFQQDGDTYQYIWRDWVVNAFNRNLPFDRFTIEQIAGDLLTDATLDQRIATGFNRMHLLNGEGGAIAEEQRNVILFDRVDVTATTWLGATMACAQCHDHKYDPISQKDYYRFLAFFNNVPESGVPPGGGQYRIAEPSVLVADDAEKAQLAAWNQRIADAKTPEAKAAATKERDALQNRIPRVMVMSDARPRKTFVLERGDYESPRDEVTAGTPAALPPMSPDLPRNRLGLARWLVSPDNPLTARVQVNRFWQQFFGVGLVKTSENLGVQADPPSHPELLDWLASEFRRDWNVKRLVRMIVTSATYQQASIVTPELRRRDPENRLLARGPRFRLPSAILRDVALASSGLLDTRIGGKPVYPYQPTGIWDGLSITKERDFTYPQSTGPDLYRRSLYTFWRRTVAPGNLFDASSRQTCTVRKSITNTPLHALTTLNDTTWVEAGRALAERVLDGPNPDPDARLAEAFRRVCARRPKPAERAILRRSLDRALAAYRADPAAATAFLAMGASPRDPKLEPAEHAAYASVCLAVFNLDEALTKE